MVFGFGRQPQERSQAYEYGLPDAVYAQQARWPPLAARILL